MFIIEHKFAGYVTSDCKKHPLGYCLDYDNATQFETQEEAEIEIGGYLEKVVEIKK